MNILHISPYVPSVHASHAGGVCMGKEVETLKKNHTVYVLSFINNEKEEELAKEHDPDKSYFVHSNTSSMMLHALGHLNKPNYFAIRSSKEFSTLLKKIVQEKKIDAIHCEYTSMGQYVWIKDLYPNLQFNLVEHDITVQSYERMSEKYSGIKKLYYQWQLRLVKKEEQKCCSKADHVIVVNKKDLNLMKQRYNINAIVMNPYYGITVENYQESNPEENTICFVGQMGREENHEAAMRLIHIFKSLDSNQYKLNIIGAHPKQELLAEECNNIHITGFVDDIEAEIKKNQIAVFPLNFGAGIKLKVLLAFGLGLPVITTNIGAEGIDEDGNVLVLAKTDEEFKSAILDLFRDPAHLKSLSKQSAEFVFKNFSWQMSEKVLADLYKG